MKAMLAAVLALFALEVHAQSPCAGFADVDGSSAFCAGVAWVKNRGVTTGCGAGTTYCPNDPVTRLAMAAFLSRMDRVLPPALVDANGKAIGAVIDQSGGVLKIAYRTPGRMHLLEVGLTVGATTIGYAPFHYTVWFTTANCTGAAYRDYAIWPPFVPGSVGFASGLGVSVMKAPGQILLYASPSPLPSALPYGLFNAQSALDADGSCVSQARSLEYALPMTLVEDLAAKFASPYLVQ